jgi:hypothetical protein
MHQRLYQNDVKRNLKEIENFENRIIARYKYENLQAFQWIHLKIYRIKFQEPEVQLHTRSNPMISIVVLEAPIRGLT